MLFSATVSTLLQPLSFSISSPWSLLTVSRILTTIFITTTFVIEHNCLNAKANLSYYDLFFLLCAITSVSWACYIYDPTSLTFFVNQCFALLSSYMFKSIQWSISAMLSWCVIYSLLANGVHWLVMSHAISPVFPQILHLSLSNSLSVLYLI